MATWIFQGAKGFDINGYLLHSQLRKQWRVSPVHLRNEVNARDCAFIWRSVDANQGPSGIVGKGEVLVRAITMAANLPEFYDDPSDAKECMRTEISLPRRWVRLTIEDGMLQRDDLRKVPELANLSILRQPQASTFRVSPAESQVLMSLWERARLDRAAD
jgi:hypothetical protein